MTSSPPFPTVRSMKIARTLIAFLIATGALAQAPGEDRVLAYFQAFNSGSAEQVELFAQANFTPQALQRRNADERRAMFEQIRGAHGKLTVAGIRASNDGLRIDVEDANGETLQFRFTIESAPPHRIAGLGINIGGGREEGPQLPPLKLPSDFSAPLDAYVKQLPDFSGTVLVAKNGEVLFEKAYGLASRRFGVPNKTTTRFNVGSITKDFTKVAIGQLAQAGKLKLDVPIVTYLPSYPNKEIAQKITTQQLVDHRSGLGDIFTPRFFETNALRFRGVKDYVEFFASDPLQYEPGKGQRYSNYGYVVLGAIIEAVSGENYFDYIRKHVFDPAGMTGSGFFELEQIVSDIAIGHSKEAGEWREIARLIARGIPAGGSYSTVRDLLNFDRGVRAKKLLDEQWTRWFFKGDAQGSRVSAGGSPGVNGAVASDGVWTVVVLTNIDPPTGENFAEALAEALKI